MPTVSASQRKRIARVLKHQFPFPFNIDKFLDRAIREFPEDPASFAYALIIDSKAFRERFRGIFREDGTLRISPAEYVAREEQYASIAAQYGFGLNRFQVGKLIKNDVDPTEFTLRARGAQLARTNPQLIEFLNQQINFINQRRRAAAGDGDFKRIPRIDNRKEAINFFTGRADRELYAIYEGAVFRETAAQLGLDITKGQAAKLAARTPGVLDAEDIEGGFVDIAQKLRFAGVELSSVGISQRELEILEFGGPGRAAIREKVERELANRQADVQADPNRQPLTLVDDRPVTRAALT